MCIYACVCVCICVCVCLCVSICILCLCICICRRRCRMYSYIHIHVQPISHHIKNRFTSCENKYKTNVISALQDMHGHAVAVVVFNPLIMSIVSLHYTSLPSVSPYHCLEWGCPFSGSAVPGSDPFLTDLYDFLYSELLILVRGGWQWLKACNSSYRRPNWWCLFRHTSFRI